MEKLERLLAGLRTYLEGIGAILGGLGGAVKNCGGGNGVVLGRVGRD